MVEETRPLDFFWSGEEKERADFGNFFFPLKQKDSIDWTATIDGSATIDGDRVR